MEGFMDCIQYLAVVSFLGFLSGRALPKRIFRADRFPFQSFAFEKNGEIYEKLGIRHWKGRVPDMSRIFPKLIPSKDISENEHLPPQERYEMMVQETCIAELVHDLLCLAGLVCIRIWRQTGGVVVSVLYAVGNLIFVMIQRYNRPRFLAILKRYGGHSEKKRVCRI